MKNIISVFLKICLTLFFLSAAAKADEQINSVKLKDVVINSVDVTEPQIISSPLNCAAGWFDFELEIKRLSESATRNRSLIGVSDGYNEKWSWSYSGDSFKQGFFGFRYLVQFVFPRSKKENQSQISITNLRYNYRPKEDRCVTMMENKFEKLEDGVLQTYGAAFDGIQSILRTNLIKKNNYTDLNCFHITIQDNMGQVVELESGSQKFAVTFPISVVYHKSCETSRPPNPEDKKKDFELSIEAVQSGA